jgi:hypothetical protein
VQSYPIGHYIYCAESVVKETFSSSSTSPPFPSPSSSSAALQPGVGFGLLYKLIPLLSISSHLLPIR